MAEEDREDQVEQPKKNPMMLIIIGAVALLLIVIIVVVMLMMGDSGAHSEPQRVDGGVAAGVEASMGPVAELKQFIVNLQSNDGRRYLKVEMTLELNHKNSGKEVENKIPLIRDVIIGVLSAKRFDEVATENGKIRLREELKVAINRHLIDGQVRNIYFTTFVIQ